MEGKQRKRIRMGGPTLGLISVLIMIPCLVRGQGTTEYRPATWNYPGARSAGLGDAVSSDTYDIEGMYQNPAVLSFLRNPSLMLDFRHDWYNKIIEENLVVPILAGHSPSFGLGIGAENSGAMSRNRVLFFKQLDINAACSFKLSGLAPDLSVGILGEFRIGRDDSVTRSAARFSLGLLYAPDTGPSYSVVYRGLGKTIGYRSVPGVGGNSTTGRLEESPRSLEIGSTMRFPELSRSPIVTISVAGERDFISSVFRLKGGIEATFFKLLSLRLGYQRAEIAQLRCGAGLTVGSFSIDYALMPSELAGQFDEITVKVAF
jgi:hypothetical protein